MAKKSKNPTARGPKPNHLKINETFEDAVQKAVRKEKPKEGWPKEQKGSKSK